MDRMKPLVRLIAIAFAAFIVTACGSLVPSPSGPVPGSVNGASRTASAPDVARPARGLGSTPRGYRQSAGQSSCIADLDAAGVRFDPLPDTYAAPGCNKLGTVQLSALAGDEGPFGISNLGPVKCGTAKAFSAWARFGVDRAARQILGSPLMRIETMGSYACRNVSGTSRRSAHARADAIDVSAFVLEDGRRISLQGDWNGGTPAEREFLRIVHKSACKRFGTVLGPEYNAAHRDHFHLEGTGPRFCR